MESKQTSSKVLDFLTSPLTGQRRKEKPVSVQMAETGIDFTPVGTVSAIVEDPSLSNIAMQVAPDVLGLGPIAKAVIKKSKAADVKEAERLLDDPEALKEWQKTEGGKGQRQKNPEASEQAAEALYQGEITSKEARKIIEDAIPSPELYTSSNMPEMPTVTEVVGSLGKKAGKYGILGVKGFDLKAGQEVSSRLDIPAYNNYDKWVVSIHDGTKDAGAVVGFGQAIRLKNIRFGSKAKESLDIARRKVLKEADPEKGTPEKRMGKSTIARIFGEYVPEDSYKLQEEARRLLADPDSGWTQVGMNPYRKSAFYDKATGKPVFEADEVIQVGPLVLAKNVKKPTISQMKEMAVRTKDGKLRMFNEGGMAMKDQMEMAFMDEGGIIDDDMEVDPVSGNEVPPGSLAEEVRDDIPAQLSEGEYVVPADVVRYYGVKFFEDLRERAKIGLSDMEANGRIGGEPVPDGGPKMGDSPLSPEEQDAVNSILGMAEGGTVQNPYLQQQQMYTQPAPQPMGNARGFSEGGLGEAPEQDDDIPEMTQSELTTPTVYNDASYSFLSDSPKVEESFTAVPMINPDTMAEILATTKKMYDQKLQEGFIPKKDYDASQADTTTTPTTGGSGGSGGGSGGSTTVTPKGGGFKNWGDDIDWSDPESITQFVNDSQEGMIDPKTGKKLAQAGLAIGGPGLGAVGGAVGTVSQMGAISDMRAAAIIARAQGNDSLATTIEGQVEQVLKNSSGLTRLMDKFFKGMMDGDAKAKAKMDKLGLKYDPDNITEYSSEQIAANKNTLSTTYKKDPQPVVKEKKKKKKNKFNITASQNQASKGTASSKAKAQSIALKSGNVSTQTASKLSGAGMKAGANVGAGAGGSNITGVMNKGGLMTKGKKKK